MRRANHDQAPSASSLRQGHRASAGTGLVMTELDHEPQEDGEGQPRRGLTQGHRQRGSLGPRRSWLAFKRSFSITGEMRTPEKTGVRMGGRTAARFAFGPGWRWSECPTPVVATDGQLPGLADRRCSSGIGCRRRGRCESRGGCLIEPRRLGGRFGLRGRWYARGAHGRDFGATGSGGCRGS